MVGDIFHINATYRDLHGGEYVNFGVHPKYRYMFGVSEDEQIYNVEFEVIEECPKYPNEIKTEYFAWCREWETDFTGKSEHTNGVSHYNKRETPEYSLVESNVVAFTTQFPQPVFEYQYKPYFGKVVKLKVNKATPIE